MKCASRGCGAAGLRRRFAHLHGAVFAWLGKYADHEPDWADGMLVALATHLVQSKVWTYDTEFWTTWRTPQGKRVPLFVDPRRPRRAKG